jgi:hypothetical protein
VAVKACAEKTILASAYDDATRKYAQAVATLKGNIGICAKDQYDVFFGDAEVARKKVVTARECLATHIEQHRC